MKILIHANAVWAGTGYGQQAGQLARHLQADGHDVAISAFYGLNGAILNWGGMNVYPGGYDMWGNDVLERHAAHHFGGDQRDGLVITLVDVWVLNPEVLSRLYTACWTPVDHEPVPPRVLEVLEASGAWPVAMSRFGERMLTDAGLDPLYAPHGIDTDVFRPGDKQQARRDLQIPEDAFVVGMVAANKGQPPRKGWPQAVAAFAEFARAHEDAFLFLHTEPSGAVHGVDLRSLLSAYAVPVEKVRLSDPYFGQHLGTPPEFVAGVYQAFDVLLNPSYGEGFGIPLVEAQACGVPVIATDFSAMSELAHAGWLVSGERVWTEQRSFWTVPTVERIVWALGEAHTRAHRLGDVAREFALGYDEKLVYEQHWRPILAELERRMVPLPLPQVSAPVAA